MATYQKATSKSMSVQDGLNKSESGTFQGTMHAPEPHPMKYLSLGLLLIQNSCLILVMRQTRTAGTSEGHMYMASTAVVLTEIIKLVVCFTVILFQSYFDVQTFLLYLYNTIIANPLDTLKVVSVPALAYALQNNLIYEALSHLSVATYHASMQMKIFTTAMFSMLMLRKTLSRVQWGSLVILFIGVAVVQIQPKDTDKQHTEKYLEHIQQDTVYGLFIVILMCLSSGFSAVYFEKILKETAGSVWLRNIQLGIYGILFSTVAMFLKDGAAIREKGFFHGYTPLVWFVVVWQAFGGLLVALVVKYADNILKLFTTALALVISVVASVYLFGFHINLQFCFGAGLVILAGYLYTRNKSQPQPQIYV